MPSIELDGKKSVARNAREYLPALAREFFASGRKAAQPSTSHRAMHGFRLEIKRFRYTLELFRDCYGPGIEERIEALQQLQHLLGAISDCWATDKLLAKREDLSKADLQLLRKKLERLARGRVASFQSQWAKDFAAERNERAWVAYLSKPRAK